MHYNPARKSQNVHRSNRAAHRFLSPEACMRTYTLWLYPPHAVHPLCSFRLPGFSLGGREYSLTRLRRPPTSDEDLGEILNQTSFLQDFV